MNSQLKYFLYLRKSTDREDMQVLSIDGQRDACKAFATQHSLLVVDTLVEHESANTPGRPAFNEMLSRLEKGEAEAVLAYHPNRLARNSKDGGELIYRLDTGRIKDFKFPVFWFENNAQGKFMLGLEFVQSKRYSDDLSIVTKRGLLQKCHAGYYPSLAPRGYINNPATKTVEFDPQVAPIIRKMFALYAQGNTTLLGLAEFLKKNGIVSIQTRRCPGGKLIDQALIRRILANPFYYGSFIYDGVIYQGKHPPLISKALFDKVQKVLADRSIVQPLEKQSRAFMRLCRCGECGMMITAEEQKGFIYYRCTRKSRIKQCRSVFVREEEMNRQISELLMRYAIPEKITKDWLARVKEERKTVSRTLNERLQSKRNEITALNQQIERLVQTYMEQLIDPTTFRSMQHKLHSSRATLREQLVALEKGDAHWLELFENWINTAQNLAIIALGAPTLAKRLSALQVFGSNLTLTGGKVSGKAVEPWWEVDKTGSAGFLVNYFTSARKWFESQTPGVKTRKSSKC